MNTPPSFQRKNDVFFIGAGFSRAISQAMPTLVGLSDTLLLPQDKELLATENIEHFLTLLSQSFPWMSEREQLKNRSRFLEIADQLTLRISTCQEEAIQIDIPASRNDWLRGLVGKWHELQSHVITMNYDTLIESCLEVMTGIGPGHTYPIPLTNPLLRSSGTLGGEEKPTLKLYKLHGSINWFYSGNRSFYGETIYLNHAVGVSKYTHAQRADIETYLVDKVPLIIPPTVEKTSYFSNETVRSLWRSARVAIDNAQTIYFLGYSLPETDLMVQFLLNSIVGKGDKSVVVVDIDQNVVSKYKRLLNGRFTVKLYGASNPADPIPNFVSDYLQGSI